jgi:hypothetical protein
MLGMTVKRTNNKMSNSLKRTNLRIWKLGLRYAMYAGLLQGVIAYGVVKKIEWQELLIMIIVNIAIAGHGYLQKHPIEEVSDEDTKHIKQTTGENDNTK